MSEHREKLEPHMYESNCYTRLLVRRPCTVISAYGLAIFLMAVIIAAGALFEVSDNSDRDFKVRGDSIVDAGFALEEGEARILVGDGSDGLGVAEIPRTFDDIDWQVIMMYRSKRADNLLTVENLNNIAALEAKIRDHPDYDKFCWAGSNYPGCDAGAVLSVRDIFPEAINASVVDAELVANAALINAGAPTGEDLNNALFAFGAGFAEDGSTDAVWARSLFKFGAPLEDDGTGEPYRNSQDRDMEQREKFETFSAIFNDVRRDFETDEMQIYFVGEAALTKIFTEQVFQDFIWALGAISFVLVYLIFHTRSCMIGSLGMLEILLAFIPGFFLYRVVANIAFFQGIHILVVFVILGVGGDDIFVLVDAWNQAGTHPELRYSMEKRMAYTWKRAGKAMLITSFTTIAAFLGTATSRLIPVATFGFWAAFLLFANFVCVIGYFPAVLLLWHTKVRGRRCRFCVCCSTKEATRVVVDAESLQAKGVADGGNGGDLEMMPMDDTEKGAGAGSGSGAGAGAGAAGTIEVDDVDDNSERHIERFFRTFWHPKVIDRLAWPLLVVLAITFGVTMWRATEINPQSEADQFFPSDHWLAVSLDAPKDFFRKTAEDNSLDVNIVFGIAGLDTSSAKQFVPDEVGTAVWDDDFDLSSAEAQNFLVDTCDTLQASDLVFEMRVTCFMWDYRDWRVANGGVSAFPAVFSADPEVQRTAFADDLLLFTQAHANATGFDYRAQFFVNIDPVNGRLRFVVVRATSPLPTFEPYSITFPVYEQWQELVEDLNEMAPDGMDQAFQTAPQFWAQMISEKELVDGAFRGMGLAAGVAFAVLLVSTMNVVLSLYAILCVAGIVAGVMASIVSIGWELGVSESMGLVVLIGFSVDFCVHLAIAYVECPLEKRSDKTRVALTQLGISVVAGGMTTIGAALFLFGPVLLFFTKFGVLMSLTICFSLLYSLVFFVSLTNAIGPEGNFGDLTPAWKWVKARWPWCKKDKSAAVGDDQ